MSAHVQVEREGGEAETDVTQVSKIQSEDVNVSQINMGTNVNKGPRVMKLAAGEARRVGGGVQRTGDDEGDKGECEHKERSEAAHDGRQWQKGAREGRRRAERVEALVGGIGTRLLLRKKISTKEEVELPVLETV